MRIVHFATTRIAGNPIRLVRALQAHTSHDVRLVDLQRWTMFEQDLVYADDAEEAIGLAEGADIIHLHNYLDYDSTDFRPIDFGRLRDRGTLVLRHFHSTPETIANHVGIDVSQVLSCPIPSVVAAGHQERFYPHARVVPIVIPQDDPLYTPSETREGVFFGPSMPNSAWSERWNTKGMPEVTAMLREVGRTTGCRISVVYGRPLAEVMEQKRRSLAVVDDLITGTYHTSGLEGLSVGRPVLCFVDDRVRFVLREISGSPTCPFVVTRLEHAREILVHLVRHPDEAAGIGADARAWVDRHWADRDLAGQYLEVYEQLARTGSVTRQPSLGIEDGAHRFVSVVLPDLVYEARRRQGLAARPLRVKLGERSRALCRGLLGLLPAPVADGLRAGRRRVRRPR